MAAVFQNVSSLPAGNYEVLEFGPQSSEGCEEVFDTRFDEFFDQEPYSYTGVSIANLQNLVDDGKSTVQNSIQHSSIPPIYEQLKSFIVPDATRTGFPISLLSSVSNATGVKAREKMLLESFDNLRALYPEPIIQLSCLYKYYSASIEMERLDSIQGELSNAAKDYHNQNFDCQLHKIIDRVEDSLKLLSSRGTSSPPVTRTRPVLTRNSLKVLEEWYECHLDHPYPTASQIEWLAQVSNPNTEQVKKWFGNKRSRSKNTRSLTEIAKMKRRQRLLKRH
uniref:Spiralian-TALE-A homeobox protein n=1 Tax=Nipponacmea fuscoviridis TaxID=225302 RepID=A0A1L7NS50_9GAST|nr:spiralian-TALE-A homeobox protein [Nipponacmea fuscoviridis]